MDCKLQPVHTGLQPLVNQQVPPSTAERSTRRSPRLNRRLEAGAPRYVRIATLEGRISFSFDSLDDSFPEVVADMKR